MAYDKKTAKVQIQSRKKLCRHSEGVVGFKRAARRQPAATEVMQILTFSLWNNEKCKS